MKFTNFFYYKYTIFKIYDTIIMVNKMKYGKLIVIEGTDCSGKETQAKLLIEKLQQMNIPVKRYSNPWYDTPTGKIVGGPYLGKSYICEGWFPEGAPSVDPKVSCLYYAADRRYNRQKIVDDLSNGINIIQDRYVYSNMAHQGGKLATKEERDDMFNWIEKLEFDLLGLPQADIKIFLHMPYEPSLRLKESRIIEEKLDQLESSKDHLLKAEKAYLELSDKYRFKKIECTHDDEIKTIEEIHQEVFDYVLKCINNN